MTGPALLGVTLAGDHVVGSNLRGAMSGAGWLYALPRLDYGHVVVLGRPSRATLAALARLGRVTVVARGRTARDLGRMVTLQGWSTVTVVAEAPAATIDLLAILDARPGQRAIEGLIGRLGADGVVVAIGSAARVIAWPEPTMRLWVTPGSGEVRAVGPIRHDEPDDHPTMLGRLRSMGLTGTRARRRPLVSLERWMERRGWLGPGTRAGVVAGSGLADAAALPAYLADLAGIPDHERRGVRWAIAARGDYDSQKVLVLVDRATPAGSNVTGSATEPHAAGAPRDAVIKVTRSAAFAPRLRNEAAALRALRALPIAVGRVPVHWFDGEHAGRAVLGATRMTGRPFPEAAAWDAADPLLVDAIGWLQDLGVTTAVPRPAQEVADVLDRLLERYAAIHRPSSGEHAALQGRFATLRSIEEPIPSVMQHGDPGIWNLLADSSGRTVFLDWEAAEPAGLPLWDLLYCFRSYAIAMGRRSGDRDRLAIAAAHLLGPSALADRLVASILAYRQALAIPPAAIEPLIYGCWLHRSLKEATRMSADRVSHGQFVRLLRRMLASPDAPVLARLASPVPPAVRP